MSVNKSVPSNPRTVLLALRLGNTGFVNGFLINCMYRVIEKGGQRFVDPRWDFVDHELELKRNGKPKIFAEWR